MRNRRTTLLAGIAAFALIAGTGFVAAQETSQGNKSTMQPHAGGTNMKTEKEGAGGKMGPQSGKMDARQGGESTHAQGMQKGKMGENESSSKAESKTGKNAERMNKSTAEGGKSSETKRGEKYGEEKGSKGKLGEGKANKEKFGEGKGERNKEGATAEQRRNGSEDQRLHGLQGNASHVTLNDQQRTRIRDTVINARGAPRVGSVDFDVAVGTAIPRDRIHIVPVPETLVEIYPAWRGFRYFIYEDEIVVVDPEDMRIIAVLPV